MDRIVLNGLNQRPGGGVVVLEALANGLRDADPRVVIEIVVLHPDTLALLAPLRVRGVTVTQVAGNLPRLDRFLSPRLLRRSLGSTLDGVLITLNHHVPGCALTQVVYHVNLARFERDEPFALGAAVLQWLRDKSSRSALERASANVFESDYVLGAARRRYPTVEIRMPSVVYIGIDERHLVDDTALDYRQVEPRVIVITSPNPHKKNELLIPLLVELRSQSANVPWRIHVYGGHTPLVWDSLRQAAADAGVEDGLVFEGYRSREDIAAALDRSVCLYSPSVLESFSMVALEAMARGCPVLVSGESAMPESVADAGIVVDPIDAAAVAVTVSDLWTNEERRNALGRAGLERARNLRWRDSGEAFAKLCREVTSS